MSDPFVGCARDRKAWSSFRGSRSPIAGLERDGGQEFRHASHPQPFELRDGVDDRALEIGRRKGCGEMMEF
jgi:hypothetical protein